MKPLLFAFAIITLAVGSSLTATAYPPDVLTALDSSGTNRAELEKVLTHYSAPSDSLKYRAACFLIGNMEGHSYVTYDLVDTAGKAIPFNALSYPTYDSLTASYKRLETKYGSLDFKKKDITPDLKVIKADYLINQIDYAFRAWQERPWARWLSFDQFCRYVLPYRGSNEPLDPWRQSLFDQYTTLAGKLKDSADPVEAARAINNDLKSWFKFDERYYFHPTDQGISEMRSSKLGRCEDMTNLTIFTMRANGLAVTSDYTPCWADTSNNHAWNAILLPDGKAVPFMGCEANPGEYPLFHKAAKVYRKTYEKRPDNLVFLKHKQEKLPGWLAGKSYVDVTSEYMKVCDVPVDLTVPVPDSVDIAYLCVFNTGEWQPIQWGRISGKSATFAAMGTGVAYLPAYYLNEKVVPAGPPFILQNDCSVTILKPAATKIPSVQLLAIGRSKPEDSPTGVLKSRLIAGKEYELQYWNDGWQTLGKAVASEQPLLFNDIPSSCLYRLVLATDSDKEERIFTMDGVLQKFW